MKTIPGGAALALDLTGAVTGEEGIETVERRLAESIDGSSGTLQQMGAQMLGAGGKRIRPRLVLASGLVYAGLSEALIEAATAAELIHMATLAHDDVIDAAALRRSQPSLNHVWGNRFGVLFGDSLFARAFTNLAQHRLYPCLELMLQAIDSMCTGEILQAEHSRAGALSLDAYYHQIRLKTAAFMQRCCESGAVIGGGDAAGVHALGQYGLHLGLAFQIMDDILDYCGDPAAMGKARGEDFRQGILTLPVLLLHESQGGRAVIEAVLARRDYSEAELVQVTGLLHSSGAMDGARQIAASHLEAAKHQLKTLPATAATAYLAALAEAGKARTR